MPDTLLDPVTTTAMSFPFAPIAGLVGSALNFINQESNSQKMAEISRENTDKTLAYQKQAADLAYNRNMAQWDKANAYQSPAAQMARLKSAGLNPMLVYGSGSPAGNSAPSPQMTVPQGSFNYQSAQRPMVDPMSLMMNLQSMEMGKAQIRKTKAEAETAENSAIVMLVNAMAAQARIPNIQTETKYNLDNLIGNALKSLAGGKLAQDSLTYDLDARKAASAAAGTAAKRSAMELNEMFPIDVETKRINKEILELSKKSGDINYKMLEEFGVDSNAPAWLKAILRQDPGMLKKLLGWIKSLSE